MAALSEGGQPSPGPGTPIAGFWRQLAAFAIDGLILALSAMLLGWVTFRWAVGLGQVGRLIGLVVALLYFGLLNSRVGGGQTLGKRLLGIRVVDRAGRPLSPTRSALRFLVIGIPYFLYGLWSDVDVASAGLADLLAALVFVIVFGGLGATTYLFVFNRRTRQSLDDLAVDSIVVRGPGVPIGLTTPRLHLIVVGCWLALVLIGAGVGVWHARQRSVAEALKPLIELQAAVRAQLGTRQVQVVKGGTTNSMLRGGTSTTTFLQVAARVADWQEDPDAEVTRIAGLVFELQPDLLGSQVLIVEVGRGFDFGLASWSWSYRTTLDAAAWRQKLARLPAGSRKT